MSEQQTLGLVSGKACLLFPDVEVESFFLTIPL